MSNEAEMVGRLRADLESVGFLPLCERWMYEVIRHGDRNMDVDVEDGFNSPDRYAGEPIARIVNAMPALLDQLEARTPTSSVPDGASLRAVATRILAKLDSPTESVTYLDAEELRKALADGASEPPLSGEVDRYGRIETPAMGRVERRLSFIQKANVQDRPYADRDGRWGMRELINDAMLVIMAHEERAAPAYSKSIGAVADSASGSPLSGEQSRPFAYAYRYPAFPPLGATVIRLGTNGREINGAKPIEVIPLYRQPSVIASRSGEGSEAVTDADRLMVDFYTSKFYDPKAARPADTVKAAIQFTLAALQSRPVTIGEDEVERMSQALQDHMEQFHGICLKASEWNAAIAFMRQDRKA
jgi:hypothetical protein